MKPFVALAAAALFLLPVSGGDVKETKSLLERHPDGWTDLLADGIKNWKRVSIPPGSPLNSKNCWDYDAKSGTLICDGVGVHEMLLYDREFKDGTLHVEWRFQKLEGKAGYNSGVYVRNSADGKVWHQAQVGSLNVGRIFGDSPIAGKMQRFNIKPIGEQRGKPAGDWNIYEVTAKGPQLSLWINGAVTAEWNDCPVPSGHVGLEAEGYWIEFKNVKFRP
jgi:hypothetical protein